MKHSHHSEITADTIATFTGMTLGTVLPLLLDMDDHTKHSKLGTLPVGTDHFLIVKTQHTSSKRKRFSSREGFECNY